MSWRISLATICVLTLAVCAPGQKQDAAGGWTNGKDDTGLVVYRKTVTVPVVKYGHGPGNVANYHLKLDRTQIDINESDGGTGYGVRSPEGGFEVRADKQRDVAFTVRIGQYGYVDLNGDGVIDGMYDGARHRPYIFLDGRYVEVEQTKTGLGARNIRSPDHGVTYVFEGEKWRVR
jgi:hypothetical protein